MVHIDDFLLLGNTQVVLGILSSCLVYQLFFSHLNNSFFLKKKISFGEFQLENFVGMWNSMGLGSWESIQGPLVGCQG